MSFGRYFRFALLAPLLIGGICIALSVGGQERLVRIWLVEFTAIATLVGGVPYLVYALVLYVWSASRTDEAIRGRYWLLPLFYPLYVLPVPLLWFGISGGGGLLLVLGILGGVALVYAYAYAILIYAGWLLLKNRYSIAPGAEPDQAVARQAEGS